MKVAAVISTVALLACASREPTDTLRGELDWRGGGMMVVWECSTKQRHEIGVMASAPYFSFVRRAEEVSQNDPEGEVVVELLGFRKAPATSVVERGAEGVFEIRKVISMTPGGCDRHAG